MALCCTLAVPHCLAQCPTLEPLTAPEAEGDPVYAELCGLDLGGGGDPLPCPTPNVAPSLVPGSERAQGMVLHGEVPGGYGNMHAVWWMAEALNDQGFLETIWTYRSVDGMPPGGLAPGSGVDFGAPGLPENTGIRFRVTFEDENGYKLCWSDRSASYDTLDFDPSSTPPALPNNIYLKVQEDFDRPETHEAVDDPPGDGLGPEVVWKSDALAYPPVALARIAEDGSSAVVPPSSSVEYEMRTEQHQHTFAESKFSVDLVRSSGVTIPFNLQIQARIGNVDPSTGEAPSYAVKLLKGIRDCNTHATLIAFRLPDEYGAASCDANGDPLPETEGVFCQDAATGEEPPLDVEDPNHPGLSWPVWLRIEVENKTIPDLDPVVTGTAYWQNSQGEWRSCFVERPFEDDPGNMKNILGKWGMSFHDKWYRLDSFRAGDGAP